MNTPAFTNLLGVRVRTSKLSMSIHRKSVELEGTVMAVAFGEYLVDTGFGVQVHTNEGPQYLARGFVVLLLTDAKELHTAPLDALDPPAKVIG